MNTPIDWKAKLSSRKFWAAVSGLIISIAVIIGSKDSDIQLITGVIAAISNIAIYIFGEAIVDAAKMKG